MAVWILQHMDERWFSKFLSNSPEPGTPGKFHETERRSGWQSREGSRLHVYNFLGHNFCLLGANPRQRLPRMRSEEKLNITLEDRSILWMNEDYESPDVTLRAHSVNSALAKRMSELLHCASLLRSLPAEQQNVSSAHVYCAGQSQPESTEQMEYSPEILSSSSSIILWHK